MTVGFVAYHDRKNFLIPPFFRYFCSTSERGLKALIKQGFLKLVYGGVAEGDFLCHHPLIDELHLTGSIRTFEAIAFGPGPEGEQRKAEKRPLLDKRFTCELGNITPVIIAPGPWSEREIADQANQIATWLVANGGRRTAGLDLYPRCGPRPARRHLLHPRSLLRPAGRNGIDRPGHDHLSAAGGHSDQQRDQKL